MIKNKDILALLERKKNEISCDNCDHCNLNAYHSGKWYCRNPEVSVFNPPTDISACFAKRKIGKKRAEI